MDILRKKCPSVHECVDELTEVKFGDKFEVKMAKTLTCQNIFMYHHFF
jgi:hypothetical protein